MIFTNCNKFNFTNKVNSLIIAARTFLPINVHLFHINEDALMTSIISFIVLQFLNNEVSLCFLNTLQYNE